MPTTATRPIPAAERFAESARAAGLTVVTVTEETGFSTLFHVTVSSPLLPGTALVATWSRANLKGARASFDMAQLAEPGERTVTFRTARDLPGVMQTLAVRQQSATEAQQAAQPAAGPAAEAPASEPQAAAQAPRQAEAPAIPPLMPREACKGCSHGLGDTVGYVVAYSFVEGREVTFQDVAYVEGATRYAEALELVWAARARVEAGEVPGAAYAVIHHVYGPERHRVS